MTLKIKRNQECGRYGLAWFFFVSLKRHFELKHIYLVLPIWISRNQIYIF